MSPGRRPNLRLRTSGRPTDLFHLAIPCGSSDMATARRVHRDTTSVLHESVNPAGVPTQATLSPKRESPPSRGSLVVLYVAALVGRLRRTLRPPAYVSAAPALEAVAADPGAVGATIGRAHAAKLARLRTWPRGIVTDPDGHGCCAEGRAGLKRHVPAAAPRHKKPSTPAGWLVFVRVGCCPSGARRLASSRRPSPRQHAARRSPVVAPRAAALLTSTCIAAGTPQRSPQTDPQDAHPAGPLPAPAHRRAAPAHGHGLRRAAQQRRRSRGLCR